MHSENYSLHTISMKITIYITILWITRYKYLDWLGVIPKENKVILNLILS